MKKSKRVVMCVDDDSDFLESMELILEGGGYGFVSAGSAEEGLRLYRKEKPDILFIDLMMEEIDAGITLARELRALGNDRPVYMLTSVGDEMHKSIDSRELGLSGVLQKPLDAKVLLDTLKNRLG